uniref:Uncharacterized protein n=1 Tax=Rhizophora mucronata TaxID=61149 RepID=A0A2P2QQJ2_RHIMU
MPSKHSDALFEIHFTTFVSYKNISSRGTPDLHVMNFKNMVAEAIWPFKESRL